MPRLQIQEILNKYFDSFKQRSKTQIISDGGVHVLTVLAWPNRGKPGKVSIVQDSPDQHTWVRAQVTFKKVDRDFLLMFRAIGPKEETGRLILGLDDVKVLQGRCSQ